MEQFIGFKLFSAVFILNALCFNHFVSAVWLGTMGSGRGILNVGEGRNGGLEISGMGHGSAGGGFGLGDIPEYLRYSGNPNVNPRIQTVPIHFHPRYRDELVGVRGRRYLSPEYNAYV